MNGGPEFTFSEAISFQVSCTTQDEVDRYWSSLSGGGAEGPCGWLKDRYGVSWQIVPTRLVELLGDPDREKSQRVMRAMLQMTKIDISALERAAAETDRLAASRAEVRLIRVRRDEKRVLSSCCSVRGPGVAPPDERVASVRGEAQRMSLPSLSQPARRSIGQ